MCYSAGSLPTKSESKCNVLLYNDVTNKNTRENTQVVISFTNTMHLQYIYTCYNEEVPVLCSHVSTVAQTVDLLRLFMALP